METFVFALRLQQLRCSALVLRLQTHGPKKRTAAECVLSLRQLDSQETEHWLELNPPSKSSVSCLRCMCLYVKLVGGFGEVESCIETQWHVVSCKEVEKFIMGKRGLERCFFNFFI